jgi:plastocyanin
MSWVARNRAVIWAGVLAAVLLFGGLRAAVSDAPVREVTLVARGMAFYLESDPETPNPAIEVHPGEIIRVTLRNEERGIAHDFAVPAIGDAAIGLLETGERESVTFTAPDRPGMYEYVCRPHRLMMRGRLTVVERSGS